MVEDSNFPYVAEEPCSELRDLFEKGTYEIVPEFFI